jgi:hypothetical protein
MLTLGALILALDQIAPNGAHTVKEQQTPQMIRLVLKRPRE